MKEKKKKQVTTHKKKSDVDKFTDSYNLSGKQIRRNTSYLGMAKNYSKKLRENPTKAEKGLIEFFDSKKVIYEFQKPIFIHKNLNIEKFYIVDFFIPAINVIVELDGEYHNTIEQYNKDTIRYADIRKLGYTILRFDNDDVYTPNKIVLKINDAITSRYYKKK